MNKQAMILGGVAIGSFAAGAASSFFYARKKFSEVYEDRLREELDEARDYFRVLYKREGYETPQEAVEALIKEGHETNAAAAAAEALKTYGGHVLQTNEEANEKGIRTRNDVPARPASKSGVTKKIIGGREIVLDEGVETHNIFADNAPGPPLGEEDIVPEDSETVYIITQAMYERNEDDYRKVSFTYYEGDNTLADERDGIADDSRDVIGEGNLRRFGEVSGDPYILYVCNEEHEILIEVAKSDGKYSEEVAGLHNTAEGDRA